MRERMRTSGEERQFPVTCAVTAVVIIVVLAVVMALTCTVRVKYGTVRPVTRWGELTGKVLGPGIHWRWPIMEGTVVMPTTVRSYETGDNPDSSKADFTDYAVNAQTVDGQQVSIKYTVLFRIPSENAVSILQNVGPLNEVVENVVKAHSRNLTRLLAQGYAAEALYSGDGIFEYQEAVRKQLAAEIGRYGVLLDDLLIRKLEFDADYIAAIEQQQIAQEAIETAQYQAEAAKFQRDQQITLGEGDKERAILMAEAEAAQMRLAADAEAYSIDVRGAALRENPELVQWEFVKNLSGVTWGILPDNGITPLIPIPGRE